MNIILAAPAIQSSPYPWYGSVIAIGTIALAIIFALAFVWAVFGKVRGR